MKKVHIRQWVLGVLFSLVWATAALAQDIAIFVVGPSGEPSPTGTFLAMCQAKVNGSVVAGFDVELNYSDNASQKLAEIQDRAVVIMADLGFTVGTNDKKTVFGAPNN